MRRDHHPGPPRQTRRAGRERQRRFLSRPPVPWPPPLQRLAILLLTARYLLWRSTATLNLSGPLATGVSLLVLIAEVLLIGVGFLQLWFSLLPQRSIADRVEQAAAELEAQLAGGDPVPRVDVLVPSCGEPLPLLERCLRACLALDYPACRVWLLDDRDRPELRVLCDRLGCGYLTRLEHHHAKAGNLNAGLAHTEAELVAVFDADVVPLRSFLRRTVGLFAAPAVGFVQTPQHDMSANPVVRNLQLEPWLLADEESFYRWIEPTRLSLGAVVCAGTGFVMRRAALQQVGGFETGTPSEDLATGIRLAAAGYENLYLAEKLSAGLAPASVGSMARQRCRWAGGTVQVLHTGANPLTLAGLSPLQRLGFFEGIAHWLAVLPQALLVVVIPLAIALLGVAPVQLDAAGVLQVGLPFQLSQLLLTRWLSVQSRAALMHELYRWIFLMPLTQALLATLLGRPQPFEVTAKSQGTLPPERWDGRLALPLLLLLALQLLAIGRALRAYGQGSGGFSEASLLVTLLWIALTSLLLLLALRACWPRPGGGGVPWFRLEQPLQLRGPEGWTAGARLLAISEEGAELALELAGPLGRAGDLHLGVPLRLQLLPIGAEGPPLLDLPWTPLVRSPQRHPHAHRHDRRQRAVFKLGGRWGEGGEGPGTLSPRDSERLQHLLYRRPGLWPSPAAPWDLGAVPRALLRLLQPATRDDWFARSLVLQCPAGAEAVFPERLRS